MADFRDHRVLCYGYGSLWAFGCGTQPARPLAHDRQWLVDQGVFSGVVITQDYLDTLGLNGPSKKNLLSIIKAICDVGCFCGVLVAFAIGERLGRKKPVTIGTTAMAIGCVLQTSAFSPMQTIVARIVSGIGHGINTATTPVWQSKTSPSISRFKLVVMKIFGFVVVDWINHGLSYVEDPSLGVCH
ncbi:hypothetical protein LTR36_005878 [Oleoguttula mirabilis]|uniref:Major facilitator superfamily (MFS) profile domain-containing protein n=1 Tax=Oleoguttula mirabilis TaxID=1507867 RepID=A0AAV9JDK9_9PEZI|nr:hypothetical protein LTR36_005878 [Oleoguttula mirabilis]